MTTNFVKCDVQSCQRDCFPNQLHPLTVGGTEYKICPDCAAMLMDRLADRGFVGLMIKTTMTHGEMVSLAKERARGQAWNMGQGYSLQ